jgi:tetratricopeptide (TPR) repeat protein
MEREHFRMRGIFESCRRLIAPCLIAATLLAAAEPSSAPPPEEIDREQQAKVLSTEAHDALRMGNLYEARRHAEKAVDLSPGNPAHHLLLSSILFRQNNFYYARHAAEKALALDPANYRTHELLGDILYQEGILGQALSRWEEVLRNTEASPHLHRKMEKAKRELKAEEEFDQVGSRNFTVRHDGTAPRVVIRSVLWQLENIYRMLEDEFRDSPPGDNIVILYSRVQFHEITATPRWVGGSYDGKIRIPVGGLSTEAEAEALGPVLTHELTHAFLRSIVGRRLPLWFEEGLAEHFEGRTAPRENSPRHFGEDVREHYKSFQDLNAGLMGRRGPVEAAYNGSALAVERLIEEKGFQTVRRMIEEIVTGKSFEQALEEEAGLSLQEYQVLWGHNTQLPQD